MGTQTEKVQKYILYIWCPRYFMIFYVNNIDIVSILETDIDPLL